MTEAEKKVSDDVAKMDLYGILEVEPDATDKAIVKAYRKRALKYHPDKNPDNPAAIEMFHKLSKALEILTDKAAKAAYDKIQKARQAAELRHKELDSKRKKLKEDLEAREKKAQENAQKQGVYFDAKAASRLKAEVDRLRKEGSRLLEEEQERLRQQLKTGQNDECDSETETAPPRLKIKWKSRKDDPDNGGYNQQYLYKAFDKYGEINGLIISSKKKGSAIVEFASAQAAQLAYENEKGLLSNPLSISWISGQPSSKSASSYVASDSVGNMKDSYAYSHLGKSDSGFQSDLVTGFSFSTDSSASKRNADGSVSENSSSQGINQGGGGGGGLSGDTDFESLVFMRMRQAQERKELAEKMAREEDTDEKPLDKTDSENADT